MRAVHGALPCAYLDQAYSPLLKLDFRLSSVLLLTAWMDHSPMKTGNLPSPADSFASAQRYSPKFADVVGRPAK